MNPLLGFDVSDVMALNSMAYLIQISVLATIGIVAGLLFRWNAATRYQILLFTWLFILALPLFSFVLQVSGTTARLHARFPEIVSFLPSPTLMYSSETERSNFTSDLVASSAGESQPGLLIVNKDSYRSLASLFCLAWLCGFAFFTSRLIGSLCKLTQLLSQSKAMKQDQRLLAVCNSVAQDFGMPTAPELRVSNQCKSPAVIGFFKPLLLFPNQLVHQLTDEQLRQVVTHEMAHIVRRDYLVVIFQKMSAAVLWFHPLIHVLNRHLALVREELCDNHVLNGTDHATYGYTLLGVAESVDLPHPLTLSVGLLTDTWSLEARVSQILNQRRKTMTKVSIQRACATGFGALAVTTALAFCHPTWAGTNDSTKLGEKQAFTHAVRIVDEKVLRVGESGPVDVMIFKTADGGVNIQVRDSKKDKKKALKVTTTKVKEGLSLQTEDASKHLRKLKEAFLQQMREKEKIQKKLLVLEEQLLELQQLMIHSESEGTSK